MIVPRPYVFDPEIRLWHQEVMACILQYTPSVSIDPVARKAKRNDRTSFEPSDVCPIMGSNLFCVWVDTVERRTAENDRGTSLLGLGPEGLVLWLNSDRRQGE